MSLTPPICLRHRETRWIVLDLRGATGRRENLRIAESRAHAVGVGDDPVALAAFDAWASATSLSGSSKYML
jgi:hypothetical protein